MITRLKALSIYIIAAVALAMASCILRDADMPAGMLTRERLEEMRARHATPVAAETMPAFPESVYGQREVFAIVSTMSEPRFYRLTEEHHLKTFPGQTHRIARYPIKDGPHSCDSPAFTNLMSLLTSEESYDITARLGCGFPYWDSMLSFGQDSNRVDVLIWTPVAIIRVLHNSEVVGGGYLGNKFSDFQTAISNVVQGVAPTTN